MNGGSETTQAPLQFYTKNLTESTLNITGKAGDGIGLTNENGTSRDVESTLGFHLAGVDIPHPTGSYVNKIGSVNLNTEAALCWVPRCTTAGKVAWVLGLVNGGCPSTTGTITCQASTSPSYTWVKVENGDDFGYYNGSDQNIGACFNNLEGEECLEHSASEQACRAACFEGTNMADECRVAKSPLALQGEACSTPGATKSCMGIFGYLADGSLFTVNRNVCICGHANREYICK